MLQMCAKSFKKAKPNAALKYHIKFSTISVLLTLE